MIHAQWDEDNATSTIVQKVLYLNYADVPKRVFKGQIFAVTLKTLSTIGQVDNLTYTFSDAHGLKLFSNEPERVMKGKYAYDTFYFLAKTQWLQTPHIEASLLADQYIDTKIATLPGKKVEVVTLNPASDFSNIIANDFEKRRSGFIVGISSVAGDRGRKSNYIYGSAKAGFSAYLSGLRNRLHSVHVQVLTVKPGFVRTKMTEGMDLPERLTAQPEEVAKDIFKAQQRGRDVLYAKGMWRWIMLVIKTIPEWLFKRMDL